MASIVEVAARAGVSRQTVSNVLNAPERVRPETRSRVEEAIEALGYHPNRTARNLRSQRAHLLALDLAPTGPHEVSPVLDRFVHALSEVAAEHGFHLLIFPRTDDPVTSHLPLADTRTVDGFVLVDTERDDRRVRVLADRQVPFVTFGRTGGSPAHDAVDVDGVRGGQLVAEHLVADGCRRVGFVGWPEGSLAGDDRYAGLTAGWLDGGRALSDVALVRCLNVVEDGVRAVDELAVRPGGLPDAIVTVSDLLAVGVMRGLRARGLREGRDVRVVGYDDAPISAHLEFPLTTVRQPLDEVARRVLARLLARLDDPDVPAVTELLEPHLVVRST
ncbi:MAG: LacI family DNA-binding transcriptional regulator [Nitriliruptoraceae bacterium]